MARVSGIISAGLAAAQHATMPTAEEMIDINVDRRTGRARDRMPSETADLINSGLAGAGAGWLFGPVGAVLGFGLAQYSANKRRAAAEAFALQSAESVEEALEDAQSGINVAMENAKTDADRAELGVIQEEFNSYRSLSKHPDPQVRANAITSALEITGQLDEKLDDFQQEARDRIETERARVDKELGWADGIRDDLITESATYRVREDAYKRMLAVEDSSWGDQVLMVNAFKMIDPNSAVLPGEAATAGNVAGVPDWALTAYNRVVRDGGRLDPNERADIVRQSGQQYRVARDDQITRNTQALEDARARGIRNEFLPRVQNAVPIPTSDELPFPSERTQGDPVDIAAIRDFDIVRDADGRWAAYEKGRGGQPGFEIRDLPLPQDELNRAPPSTPEEQAEAELLRDADLNPDGTKKSFLDTILTTGGINARRWRQQRELEAERNQRQFGQGGDYNR